MLTDLACKNLSCPAGKLRARLSDTGGLYLEAAPNGSKRWFWKYYFGSRFNPKTEKMQPIEKRLALGSYPAVGLKDARAARDAARQRRQQGVDPGAQRQLEKLQVRGDESKHFEAVAREFHKAQSSGWSPRYASRWIERMEKDLFPWIGALDLDEVTAPLLLNVLRKIESRGAVETAHTLRQTAGQVFRYGIATGRCERNPAPDLHGALKPLNVKHMAAVLEPVKAGELMRAIHDYPGQPSTRAALQLSALLFQRPANIRMMEWAELDLDSGMWTIPAAKMKRKVTGKLNGRPHFVPLAAQAVSVLQDMKPLTGHGRYVFPSLISGERPMSENTVNTALRRMGFGQSEMTAHGFRSMARTIIAERLPGVSVDVIEAQLAHGKSGPLGMAYDRAEFMEQRRSLMQTWADYLERLRAGGQVVELRSA